MSNRKDKSAEEEKKFASDYYRMTGKKFTFFGAVFQILTQTNVRYVFYLRVLQNKNCFLIHPIVQLLRNILTRKTGIEIRPQTKIGAGFRIVHPFNITINQNAILGKNINIFKGATIGYALGKRSGVPQIGSSVQIGINSTILGGGNNRR